MDGVDRKFRRVIAGIIMPVFNREKGGVVIVAEWFKINRPQEFTVLGHFVNEWTQVEKALLEYDRSLQFRDAIVTTHEERKLLWRIPFSQNVLTWYAPVWATKEIGRQKTDELFRESRLHLGEFEGPMGTDVEISSKALQVAIAYALDWNPPYITKVRKPMDEMRPVGTVGL